VALRVAHRSPALLVLSGLVAVVAVAASLAVMIVLSVVLLRFTAPFVPLALVLFVTSRHHRRRRTSRRSAGTAPVPARPPAPPRPDLAWGRARARFGTVKSEYAAHECDPMSVLRLPALSDVSVPSTARFVEAFAEAQALETDAFPAGGHAAAFVAAVERSERAWRAARDAAERMRLSHLSTGERGTVERVVKLLTTARDSDSEPERLAAYSRARAELAKLDRAGVVHMPRTAQAALDAAARGQLPA
jgi:hypothetical protein